MVNQQLSELRQLEADFEDMPCPMGCSGPDAFVLEGHDRINLLPGTFRVVECANCGLMRTNPRPTPTSMSMYYPGTYGPYVATAASRTQRGWSLRGSVRRVLELNTTRLPPVTPGRLLEIGCAAGGFLERAAFRGWEVEGIEFSDDAAQKARLRGFQVTSGPLEASEDPRRPFDVAAGWMVLEHLHDPVAGLRKLHRWVRPGGYLAVSVPNVASFDFRLFGERWYGLHLPNHLFHFTPDTLGKLVELTGWRVRRVLHQRVLTSPLMTLSTWLDERAHARTAAAALRRLARSSMTHAAFYPLGHIVAALGQTGRMTLWAERS